MACGKDANQGNVVVLYPFFSSAGVIEVYFFFSVDDVFDNLVTL